MKLRDRTNLMRKIDDVRVNSRSLLKVKFKQLGGGLRCYSGSKENFTSLSKNGDVQKSISVAKENFTSFSKNGDVQKSISVFSTQIGSPSKDEFEDGGQELIPIWQAWKNFVLNKKQAWKILYPEFNELMKKNLKIMNLVFKLRRKCLVMKCFYAIKQQRSLKIKAKAIFVRKFLVGWKKYVRFVKQMYAGSYVMQEKVCIRLERGMIKAWRKELEKKMKQKKLVQKKNRCLMKSCFESIKTLVEKGKNKGMILKGFIRHKIFMMKVFSFSCWSRFMKDEKFKVYTDQLRKSAEMQILCEDKVKELVKQLIIANQDLAKERILSSARDGELKSFLKLHADQLYKSLCEN